MANLTSTELDYVNVRSVPLLGEFVEGHGDSVVYFSSHLREEVPGGVGVNRIVLITNGAIYKIPQTASETGIFFNARTPLRTLTQLLVLEPQQGVLGNEGLLNVQFNGLKSVTGEVTLFTLQFTEEKRLRDCLLTLCHLLPDLTVLRRKHVDGRFIHLPYAATLDDGDGLGDALNVVGAAGGQSPARSPLRSQSRLREADLAWLGRDPRSAVDATLREIEANRSPEHPHLGRAAHHAPNLARLSAAAAAARPHGLSSEMRRTAAGRDPHGASPRAAGDYHFDGTPPPPGAGTPTPPAWASHGRQLSYGGTPGNRPSGPVDYLFEHQKDVLREQLFQHDLTNLALRQSLSLQDDPPAQAPGAAGQKDLFHDEDSAWGSQSLSNASGGGVAGAAAAASEGYTRRAEEYDAAVKSQREKEKVAVLHMLGGLDVVLETTLMRETAKKQEMLRRIAERQKRMDEKAAARRRAQQETAARQQQLESTVKSQHEQDRQSFYHKRDRAQRQFESEVGPIPSPAASPPPSPRRDVTSRQQQICSEETSKADRILLGPAVHDLFLRWQARMYNAGEGAPAAGAQWRPEDSRALSARLGKLMETMAERGQQTAHRMRVKTLRDLVDKDLVVALQRSKSPLRSDVTRCSPFRLHEGGGPRYRELKEKKLKFSRKDEDPAPPPPPPPVRRDAQQRVIGTAPTLRTEVAAKRRMSRSRSRSADPPHGSPPRSARSASANEPAAAAKSLSRSVSANSTASHDRPPPAAVAEAGRKKGLAVKRPPALRPVAK